MTKDKSEDDTHDAQSFGMNPIEYMESMAKMQMQFFENMGAMFEQFSTPNHESSDDNKNANMNFLGNFSGNFSDNFSGEHFKEQQSKMMEAFNQAMTINGADAMHNMDKLMDPALLDTLWKNWAKNLETMTQSFTRIEPTEAQKRDRRFGHDAWDSNPYYALLKQNYFHLSQQAQSWLDTQDQLNAAEKEQLKFQIDQFFDAISPSNSIFTNPAILEKAIETKGASFQKGWQNAANDMTKGQLTHTDPNAFILGENIATTAGKIVHETPLYQLIQYDPLTKDQLATPLVIFPPWINRYYILDLNEEKSFVKWALEQGISVFMVSWKSADESMAEVIWDDYVKAEIDAIDTICAGLDVDSVHAIGYCVAGTTLNAALALLHARGEQDKVKSATFFTTQVDFEEAGELKNFTTDAHVKILAAASSKGYLDGRIMALTFNMLRSKDLIWNYVVNNYLMGNDYPAFDLLHWNGDTTNLPAAWHKSYINDLYRENLLVIPNRLVVDGTPIDLRMIKTPAYIQAGIEDHIAPAKSVWKSRNYLSGPVRFTLAGSGHIAGVVNHPNANKYQYWRNDDENLTSLDDFIAGAKETKGSWWPDWLAWLKDQDSALVPAKGARIGGKGKLKAIEDAPGRYARLK